MKTRTKNYRKIYLLLTVVRISKYQDRNVDIILTESFRVSKLDCANLPRARKYASMAILGDVIYIYGGLAEKPLGDLYRVVVTSDFSGIIEPVPVPSFVPAVYGATLVKSPVSSNQLVLIGGTSESSPNKHFFTFSTLTSEWQGPFTIPQFSAPWWHHQTCTIDRQMFVFGGLCETEKNGHNEMWVIGGKFYLQIIL